MKKFYQLAVGISLLSVLVGCGNKEIKQTQSTSNGKLKGYELYI
nr:hypothetical protein [Enterococcus faecalis]